MSNRTIKILFVEDSRIDFNVIREMLNQEEAEAFQIDWVDDLAQGLKALKNDEYDVVLLDLTLPDSQGVNTFNAVMTEAPHIPIILLTCVDDDSVALELVRKGAQDYLVKGQIQSSLLARSIRYAIERHQMQSILQTLSLIDDLTGLYNRRGFMAIANQHLKLAQRTGRAMMLIYLDLDNMKQINDAFGHHVGDMALIETTAILKDTFRESDIIARMGGDEFTVLAIEAQKESTSIIINRLNDNMTFFNVRKRHQFELSLSLGITQYDPENPRSIEELLAEADDRMYENKRGNKES